MNPKALFKIGYGLYIIGSHKGDKINAQIANTVFQITSEPPTLAVSINKKNLTWEYIQESRAFTVSVLSQETPLSFIGQFGFKSGRDTQKFQDINYRFGSTGSPIIMDNTTAFLEAKVLKDVDAGTHTIFIGEVVDSNVLSDKPSMSYEYYHEIKRGTTPKTAPSYVEEKEPPAPPKLSKYKCLVCGYIYDPSSGDPDHGIKPGTPFESLPNNWGCPICSAGKSQFAKLEE